MSNLKSFFKHFQLTNLNLTTPFMNAEFEFVEADKEAAWALYVELITRSAVQPLPDTYGAEKTALESLYSIFPTTRKILKEYGRNGKTFAQIAILVLNQILRPFLTKWHGLVQSGALENAETSKQFRNELAELQKDLKKFVMMLAKIAEFDDFSLEL